MSLTQLSQAWQQWRARRVFTLANRLHFYRRMELAVRDGRSPKAAIQRMRALYHASQVNNAQTRLLAVLDTRFAAQGSIESALAGLIPASEHLLIATAVKRNRLTEGFASARDLAQRIRDIKAQILRQSLMPCAMLIMSLVLLLGGHAVLAQFAAIRPLESWPAFSRTFFEIGTFVLDHYAGLSLMLAAVLMALWQSSVRVPRSLTLRRHYRTLRPWLNRFPPFSIHNLLTAFTFLSAFAGLLRGGLAPQPALTLMRRDAAPYLADHLARMVAVMPSGVSPGAAMTSTRLLDIEDTMTITLLAETTGFDQAVSEAANAVMASAEARIKAIVRWFALAAQVAVYTTIIGFAVAQISLSVAPVT